MYSGLLGPYEEVKPTGPAVMVSAFANVAAGQSAAAVARKLLAATEREEDATIGFAQLPLLQVPDTEVGGVRILPTSYATTTALVGVPERVTVIVSDPLAVTDA
jgi:hypothetical protein